MGKPGEYFHDWEKWCMGHSSIFGDVAKMKWLKKLQEMFECKKYVHAHRNTKSQNNKYYKKFFKY